MKKLISFFSISVFLILNHSATAKIYFDQEADPIPIVDITVVIPVGDEANQAKEAGLITIISEMLSAGTIKKDKQTFNDDIARYGADFNFSSGNHYSYWTLQFPYIEGKDYQPLINLLKENWEAPRFTKEQFDLALLKINSSIKSSIDSDSSMLSSALKDFLNKKYLGGFPLFLDTLNKHASLEATKKFYNEKLTSVDDIWVGIVGPEKTKELAKKIVESVFTKQGKVKEGVVKNEMKSTSVVKNNIKAEKTFLIINKPGQAQTMMSFIALSPEMINQGSELDYFFSDYLLFSNGLDSFYTSVIRGEKGLAYSVYGLITNFRDFKTLSLMANPQSSREKEAFETVSNLIHNTFVKNDNLKIINDSRWNRAFTSFKNLKAIENGLPDQRLSHRMGVITGSQSYSLAISDPNDWKINRNDVSEFVEDHWKKSAIVIGAVGNAKNIQKYVTEYFPDYKIKTIPYKNVIYSKAFDEL